MFEVGKTYEITMVADHGDGHEVWYNCIVAEVDDARIRLDDGRIINTASSSFVSAKPQL